MAIALAGVGVAGAAAVLVVAVVLPECKREGGEPAEVDRVVEPTPGPPGPAQRDAGVPEPPRDPPVPGLPYEDPALPPGELRVQVNRAAEFGGKPTPYQGAILHLVTLSLGNRIAHVERTVPAGGEVVFTGLRTDGSAAYYALAVLDGDRLEAEPVLPVPDHGMRLEVLGFRSMSGRHYDGGGGGPAPAGIAEIRVQGRTGEPAWVELVDAAS
ncbi:MAG TPA: hypothetical protein VL172_23125, partial [Kofleriaceae bacterium]|nr:hypothetical protein [Kofleriaceae bacterium]